ncbi:unnamed protein product [Porites lobata]|uniref:Uncharacterized protein n=1 Tax=Porites lobata TaxID=104759 RepID=A0ABN8Q8N4_9CNID|nr:unnamed protein product [Porites lobata]
MTGAYNVCCNVFVWLFGSYWQYWCNRGPVLGLQRLNQRLNRHQNQTTLLRDLSMTERIAVENNDYGQYDEGPFPIQCTDAI